MPEQDKRQTTPPQEPMFRGGLLLMLLMAASLLMFWWMGRSLQGEALRYDEFRRYLEEGRVESVQISEHEIHGRFKEGAVPDKADEGERDGDKERSRSFRTVRVEDDSLTSDLQAQGVEFSGIKPQDSSFLTFFLYIGLGLLLLMLLTGGLARGGRGPAGALAFGKSRGKVFQERDVDVSFDDVAGIDEAKGELAEIIDFLRNPDKYKSLGAKIPKGVLLVGPPGTGKTLLARAVAGEAGVPFISINGSEFVEMFVGVGASRVRDLFEQASKAAPCIVFIDELDAIGRTRTGVSVGGGSNEEREQTLNQLLVELDGFQPHKAVIIMSATNRPEVLDPALLRPGRFDRQVLVDRPDRAGRRAILAVHARKVPLAEDLDLERIAAQTPGFAGADLQNLVNEAALAAARRGSPKVGPEDFSKAIDRVVAGLERKSRIISDEERRRVSVHEIGHAIAARAAATGQEVQKISIIPHGMAALGYTRKTPSQERTMMTRAMLEGELISLLGGRSAELLVFGEASTGAANDLQQATEMARSMVVEYGMSDVVGPVALRGSANNAFLGTVDPMLRNAHGNALADTVDTEIRSLIRLAEGRARDHLTHNRDLLDRMAACLIEAEQLEGAGLEAFLNEVSAAPLGDA